MRLCAKMNAAVILAFSVLMCSCASSSYKWKTSPALTKIPNPDKNYSAIVLEKNIYISHEAHEGWGLLMYEAKIYERIRILRQGGENKAVLSMYVFSGQAAPEIHARTITADGPVEMSSADIHVQDIVEGSLTRRIYSLPQARAGTEVEYSIKYAGLMTRFWMPVILQEDIPVVQARVTYEHPEGSELAFVLPRSVEVPTYLRKHTNLGDRYKYSFVIRNLEAYTPPALANPIDQLGVTIVHLITEANMNSANYAFQLQSLYDDWDPFSWFAPDGIAKSGALKRKARELTKGLFAREERIKVVCDYVRNKVMTANSDAPEYANPASILKIGRATPLGKRRLLRSLLFYLGEKTADVAVLVNTYTMTLNDQKAFVQSDNLRLSGIANWEQNKTKQTFPPWVAKALTEPIYDYGVCLAIHNGPFALQEGPLVPLNAPMRQQFAGNLYLRNPEDDTYNAEEFLVADRAGYAPGQLPNSWAYKQCQIAERMQLRIVEPRPFREQTMASWIPIQSFVKKTFDLDTRYEKSREFDYLDSRKARRMLNPDTIESEVVLQEETYHCTLTIKGDIASSMATTAEDCGHSSSLRAFAADYATGFDSLSSDCDTAVANHCTVQGLRAHLTGRTTDKVIRQENGNLIAIGRLFLQSQKSPVIPPKRQHDFYFGTTVVNSFIFRFPGQKLDSAITEGLDFDNGIGSIAANIEKDVLTLKICRKVESAEAEEEKNVSAFLQALNRVADLQVLASYKWGN